jgi:hypothetical protein
MTPGAFELLLSAHNSDPQRRPAPPEASEQYSDAQLYKILVAQALTDFALGTKAEFDALVRQLGDVRSADELIAFRNIRHSCKAWRHGKRMVCECGSAWNVDDPSPANCNEGPQ